MATALVASEGQWGSIYTIDKHDDDVQIAVAIKATGHMKHLTKHALPAPPFPLSMQLGGGPRLVNDSWERMWWNNLHWKR